MDHTCSVPTRTNLWDELQHQVQYQEKRLLLKQQEKDREMLQKVQNEQKRMQFQVQLQKLEQQQHTPQQLYLRDPVRRPVVANSRPSATQTLNGGRAQAEAEANPGPVEPPINEQAPPQQIDEVSLESEILRGFHYFLDVNRGPIEAIIRPVLAMVRSRFLDYALQVILDEFPLRDIPTNETENNNQQ